jgi:HAE1 family hydrophobic/amphiphilic exporter-1
MERSRKVLAASAPGARSVSASGISWVGGTGYASYPIEYSVRGKDLERLDAISRSIADRMRASGKFADVVTSFDARKPEAQATLDRQRAAALGIDARGLATTLRALVGGVKVATYEEGGERYDVRVRLEESQRDDLQKLGLIQVRGHGGGLVDLENVARLEAASGPAQIERRDRSRQVVVFANTPPGVPLGTAIAALERIVAEEGLPAGYSGSAEGEADRMRESFDAIVFAFVLALVALYMILAVSFDSYIQPAIVMLSAPLAFIGAFAALWLAGQSMSLFAQIGIVVLMGLVMRTGVLLVDCANQLAKQGRDLKAAVVEAGQLRLRPILMTTFATVAGMVPVAFARSDGAEFRNPMGILMIGGMTSSMVLTLYVVPVFYTLVAGARRRSGRRAPVEREEREAVAAAPEPWRKSA